MNHIFRENKNRFVEGKHYIALVGEELKKFKNEIGKNDLVRDKTENEVRIHYSEENKAKYQFDTQFKYAKSLYLWTEKGALLHAKSLNTDKAWEIYDYLVDFYFRAKEERKVPVTVETSPVPAKKPVSKLAMMTVVDVPEYPKILNAIKTIQDDLICMKVLLDDCKRYSSEETYKDRRKAASEVVHIIIGHWNQLFDLKPNLIQKPY